MKKNLSNHSKALSLFADTTLEIYGFAVNGEGKVTGSEVFISEVQIDDIDTGKYLSKIRTL